MTDAQWINDAGYGDAKGYALRTGDYDEPEPPPDPEECEP